MTELITVRIPNQEGSLANLMGRLVRNGVKLTNTMSVTCDNNQNVLRSFIPADAASTQLSVKLLNFYQAPFTRIPMDVAVVNLSAKALCDFFANTPLLQALISVPDENDGDGNAPEIGLSFGALGNDEFWDRFETLRYEYPFEQFRQENDFDGLDPDIQSQLKVLFTIEVLANVKMGRFFQLIGEEHNIRFRTITMGNCGPLRQFQLVPHTRADLDALRVAIPNVVAHPQYDGKLAYQEANLIKAVETSREGEGVSEIRSLANLCRRLGYNIETIVVLPKEPGGQQLFYGDQNVVP